MDEDNKIELRSGEVQEILGGIPSRLVRYGIIIFATIFALIIVFSFVFRYPDVLRSNIVVTTENPEVTLVARQTGKIDKLFVSDNEKVEKGKVIALIENAAIYEDVLYLKEQLETIQNSFDTLNFTRNIKFDDNLQLGTIQEFYSLFVTKHAELKEFVNRSYYQRNEENLRNQISSANLIYNRLWEQKEAVRKEYELKENFYKSQRKLLAKEVISSVELQKAESEMLSKKSDLDGMRISLGQREMEKFQLEQKLIVNNKEYNDYKNQYEAALKEAFSNLKNEINNWELNFILRSPIEGIVTFNKFYNENQNIIIGDRAFTVVPENVGKIIGRIELPIRGSGKVENNDKVNVKFENYPYLEYGLVRGKVSNVSLVPEDSYYMVTVDFPNGLVTNYNDSITAQSQLRGQAEIITQDLRLIQRFFNPLKALWKERINQ